MTGRLGKNEVVVSCRAWFSKPPNIMSRMSLDITYDIGKNTLSLEYGTYDPDEVLAGLMRVLAGEGGPLLLEFNGVKITNPNVISIQRRHAIPDRDTILVPLFGGRFVHVVVHGTRGHWYKTLQLANAIDSLLEYRGASSPVHVAESME